MARIGVDVGGTNTDLVLECAGGVFYHKVPTTLKNQSIGVVQGVQGICAKAGIDPSEVTIEKSFVDDLDIDSLSMVEVVMAAEDKWGVKIPDSEVKNLKAVGDAVNYISANL